MRDIHSEITAKIIASLEKGVRPWSKSWNSVDTSPFARFVRPLRSTGQPYHGVNVIILWITYEEMGYSNPYWLTYNQAKADGGQVRKGEKGTQIIFTKKITKTDDATGEERQIPIARTYTVFNAEQIDGLPEKYLPKPVIEMPVGGNPHEPIAEVEAYFDNLGMKVKHGGAKAFYSPSGDFVQLPVFKDFQSATDYYGVKYHESVHWTGHKDRLDRNLDKSRFGDEGYAMEELVAELGAAFGLASLGLAHEPREDHASYIGHWLKVLKSDKRAIFTAASAADRAVEFLHGKQPLVEIQPDVDMVADLEDVMEMAA